MKKNNSAFLLLCGLFVLVFLPWALSFWSDPDISLTWSIGSLLTDELYHGGNALKAALSGQWLLSDYNYLFMDPLMPLLQRLVYMIGGVSLLTARLPAVFLNLMLAFVLVCIVYRHSRRYPFISGLTALFLLSTNYYFFIYGRLALIDLPMAALGLTSFYFYSGALQASAERPVRKLILAGLLLYLALLMKASAVNFILAYLIFTAVALAVKQISKKMAWHTATMALAAGLAQMITLHVLRVLSNAERFPLRSDTLIRYKLPHGVGHLLHLYVTSLGNGFVLHNATLLLIVLFVLLVIIRRHRQGQPAQTMDVLMFSLLVSTFLFHGFFNYHPPRYYIILVIPIVWFVATLPSRIETGRGKTNKLAITIALAVIISANGWNVYRFTNYLLHPRFSFIRTAQAVGQAVKQNSGDKDFKDCILYDANVHTSMPFYLRLNFDYGYKFSQALHEGKKVYLISAKTQKGFTLLGSYQIYDRFTFNLYRVPVQ